MAEVKIDPIKALRLDLRRLKEQFDGLIASEANRREQILNLTKSVERLHAMVKQQRNSIEHSYRTFTR